MSEVESREMELPPPHVLLQLDAIIVAQRESDGNAPSPVMPPPAPPPAPTPRVSGTPPAPRIILRRPGGPPSPPSAPLPPATRSHVASMASAWVAACTDLLVAVKDCTNMRGLREPLVSRGFRCGSAQCSGNLNVTVPAEFPCYCDVIGKDYSIQDRASSLTTLRKYLEGALALAQTGGAYRTDAEYMDAKPPAPVRAGTSRFTGVHRHRGKWVASIKVRGSKVELGAYDDEEDAARAYDAALVEYRNEPAVNFPGEAPLASVSAALPPAPAAAPPAAPLPRNARTRTPKVIVDPPAPARKSNARPKKAFVEGAAQKANGKWYNTYMFPGREFDDLDAYRAAKKQRKERRAAYSDQAAAFSGIDNGKL